MVESCDGRVMGWSSHRARSQIELVERLDWSVDCAFCPIVRAGQLPIRRVADGRYCPAGSSILVCVCIVRSVICSFRSTIWLL